MLVFAAAKVVIFFEIKKENQNKKFSKEPLEAVLIFCLKFFIKQLLIILLSAQDEYTCHLHGFPYHKDQP